MSSLRRRGSKGAGLGLGWSAGPATSYNEWAAPPHPAPACQKQTILQGADIPRVPRGLPTWPGMEWNGMEWGQQNIDMSSPCHQNDTDDS